jgi:hypothetical protein
LYVGGRYLFDDNIAKTGRKSRRSDLLKRMLLGDKMLISLIYKRIFVEAGSLIIDRKDARSIMLIFTAWESAKYLDTMIVEDLRMHAAVVFNLLRVVLKS